MPMQAGGQAGGQAGVQAGERRVHVIQGEYHVTADPEVVLTTILGSCVAACIRDAAAGVGGMNHFLLPGPEEEAGDASVRYGVHAMELLVNGLLQQGARRHRLEAKLFGGARIVQGLTDVGALNAAFAERFIARERIAYSGGSLRGDQGRRLQFWPGSGRARQLALSRAEATVLAAQRPAPMTDSGVVELF